MGYEKNWTISGQWDFADIKILNYNDLTIDVRTENPRVGGSIPSRPTSLTHLKLGTYSVFVSIFFYFSSTVFHCNKSKRLAVSS